MAITAAEVKEIAMLARLAVAERDVDGYAAQLSAILELVEQLNNSVELDNVEPLAHPLDMTQRLREDTVTESDRRERYQRCAPSVENGFYLVPKVVE